MSDCPCVHGFGYDGKCRQAARHNTSRRKINSVPRTHLIDDIAGIVAGVVRRDRFVRLLAAIAVALSLFLGHSAWADENSNAKAYKLFMSALEEAKLGDPVNSTEALKHLDNAIEMIERLVREYPDTVLARRLSTGQVTGSFQLSELKTRRDEAMVRICRNGLCRP